MSHDQDCMLNALRDVYLKIIPEANRHPGSPAGQATIELVPGALCTLRCTFVIAGKILDYDGLLATRIGDVQGMFRDLAVTHFVGNPEGDVVAVRFQFRPWYLDIEEN